MKTKRTRRYFHKSNRKKLTQKKHSRRKSKKRKSKKRKSKKRKSKKKLMKGGSHDPLDAREKEVLGKAKVKLQGDTSTDFRSNVTIDPDEIVPEEGENLAKLEFLVGLLENEDEEEPKPPIWFRVSLINAIERTIGGEWEEAFRLIGAEESAVKTFDSIRRESIDKVTSLGQSDYFNSTDLKRYLGQRFGPMLEAHAKLVTETRGNKNHVLEYLTKEMKTFRSDLFGANAKNKNITREVRDDMKDFLVKVFSGKGKEEVDRVVAEEKVILGREKLNKWRELQAHVDQELATMSDEDKDDMGLELIPVIIGIGLGEQERLLEGGIEINEQFEDIMGRILLRVRYDLKEMSKTEIECMEHLFKSMTESPENLQQAIIKTNQMVVTLSAGSGAELEKLREKLREDINEKWVLKDNINVVGDFIAFTNEVWPPPEARLLGRALLIDSAWNDFKDWVKEDEKKLRFPEVMPRDSDTAKKEFAALRKIAEDLMADFDNHPKSQELRDKWLEEDKVYEENITEWLQKNELPNMSGLPESVAKLIPDGDIRKSVTTGGILYKQVAEIREELYESIRAMNQRVLAINKELDVRDIEPPYYPWLPIAVD